MTNGNPKKYNSVQGLNACTEGRGVSKLKLFLFALFSFFTLSSQAFAYDFNYVNNGSFYDPETYKDYKRCINILDTESDSVSSVLECGENKVYVHGIFSNYYYFSFDSKSERNNIIARYYYTNVRGNGDAIDFYTPRPLEGQGRYKYIPYSLPRAGLDYTFSNGKTAGISNYYVYHGSFYFFDPTTMNGFGYKAGKAIDFGFLVVDPRFEEGNVWLINFVAKKARSATIPKKEAINLMLGDSPYLRELGKIPFDTSYTLRRGSGSIFPSKFGRDKQREAQGRIYTEDLEFTSPVFKKKESGTNSNNQGESENKDKNKEEYNQCVSYWSNVKTFATYDRECYRSLMDSASLQADPNYDELLNWWKKLDAWDGLSDFPVEPQDLVCQRFKSRKQAYRKKRSENWDQFQADAKDNWLTPQGLDIVEKCGEKPQKGVVESAKDFFSGLKNIVQNREKFVDEDSTILQNDFELDIAKYFHYVSACKDRVFAFTPYDYKDGRAVIGNFWDWMVGNSNNVNVCRYAEDLLAKINSKYGNISFNKEYGKVLEKEFKLNLTSTGSADLDFNIFTSSGSLNVSNLKSVAKEIPKGEMKNISLFGGQEDIGYNQLFSFFIEDYKKGVDKGFLIAGYENCGSGIGVKEWDYLVYIPLVLFIVFFFKGKF